MRFVLFLKEYVTFDLSTSFTILPDRHVRPAGEIPCRLYEQRLLTKCAELCQQVRTFLKSLFFLNQKKGFTMYEAKIAIGEIGTKITNKTVYP